MKRETIQFLIETILTPIENNSMANLIHYQYQRIQPKNHRVIEESDQEIDLFLKESSQFVEKVQNAMEELRQLIKD